MAVQSFSEVFIRRPVGTTLLAVGLLLVGIVAYRFLPGRQHADDRVSDHQRHRQPARRRSRNHGGDSGGAAGAPARRDSRRHRADVAQFARFDPRLGAVRPEPQHRRRRPRRAGRNQCGTHRFAGRPAVAAELSEGQSGRHAGDDPGADLEDRSAERALRRRRYGDRAAAVAGRRRRRGQRQRCRAARHPRACQSAGARLDGPRHGGRAHCHRQHQRRRPARRVRRAGRSVTIATNDQLRTASDYDPIVVRTANGAVVRLSAVASIEPSVRNSRSAGSTASRRCCW